MQMRLALYVESSSVWSLVNGVEIKRLSYSSDVLIDSTGNLWFKLTKLFVNRIRNTH